MAPALASSLLKVTRAVEQIAFLHKEITAFLETKPYTAIAQINREAGELSIRGKVREPCQPVWSVLIGECVHNLRSALDYMVWDLVILNTGDRPRTNKTQFPIFRYEAGYDHKRNKDVLHGVSSKGLALIKSLQPFSTGEDERSPLWRLHELSNWDKHRALHLTGATLRQFDVALPKTNATGKVTGMEARKPGPFKDDTPLAKLFFTDVWTESGQMDMDGDLSCDIAFDEPGPLNGAIVIPTLLVIHERVFEVGKKISELWPA